MKRLAIITGSMSRGGAERVALCLAQYMQSKNINVFLLTSTRAQQEYEVPADLNRIVLDQGLSVENKLRRMLGIIQNLRKTIRNNNIDTALIMGVPLCIFAIPGCKGIRVVVSERNDPTHFEGKKIVQILSRMLMKKANGYVYQTHDAQNYYKDKMHAEGIVIPNPLLLDNIADPYEGIREASIVTAGRMIPQKNHMLLLESFNEIKESFPDYKLFIYGDGPLRKEFEKYIQQHYLTDRVELPGNVSDLSDRIRKAGLFVLPSNFEGMPNALIEAMALGIPSISTDCPCGGPRDLIHDGENGLLVSVDCKHEMVSAMKKILLDKSMAAHLGEESLKIRDDLSVSEIGKQWINYLEAVSK